MATTPTSIPFRRKMAVLFSAAALSTAALSVGFASPIMAATAKAGQTCKKVNQKSGKLTCTKTSKGLRWAVTKKKAPATKAKSPDTKAPDTKAPDTKAPDTKPKAPDTKAPDTKAP